MDSSTATVIEQGALVSLHFSLALASGELIDSNFDAAPASFRIGDGSMLPGFEQLLLGLTPGAELERLLPAEQAFGPVNEANRQRLPIAKFRHLLEDEQAPAAVGTVIAFKDANGHDLPGVVFDISGDSIGIDFNHPLAGKEILFRARVVTVAAPGTEPIEIKL